MPGEGERNRDHHAEERRALGEEGDVQRRVRAVSVTQMLRAPLRRLSVLILRGGCFVARTRGIIRVCGRQEPAHLRVSQSARGLKGVDAH